MNTSLRPPTPSPIAEPASKRLSNSRQWLNPHEKVKSWISRMSTDDHSMVSRNRSRICIIFAVVAIASCVSGIILVAHTYYHRWGSQNYLKCRNMDTIEANDVVVRDLQTSSIVLAIQQGNSIPMYNCGDQEQKCSAFEQPVRDPKATFRFHDDSMLTVLEHLLPTRHSMSPNSLNSIRRLLPQLHHKSLHVRRHHKHSNLSATYVFVFLRH